MTPHKQHGREKSKIIIGKVLMYETRDYVLNTFWTILSLVMFVFVLLRLLDAMEATGDFIYAFLGILLMAVWKIPKLKRQVQRLEVER